MANESQTEQAQIKASAQTGKSKQGQRRQPRVITNPNDVAAVVMMQVDAVNAKKDELTIAVKGLADMAKQLVRAYTEHTRAIEKLQSRVKALEERSK